MSLVFLHGRGFCWDFACLTFTNRVNIFIILEKLLYFFWFNRKIQFLKNTNNSNISIFSFHVPIHYIICTSIRYVWFPLLIMKIYSIFIALYKLKGVKSARPVTVGAVTNPRNWQVTSILPGLSFRAKVIKVEGWNGQIGSSTDALGSVG